MSALHNLERNRWLEQRGLKVRFAGKFAEGQEICVAELLAFPLEAAFRVHGRIVGTATGKTEEEAFQKVVSEYTPS